MGKKIIYLGPTEMFNTVVKYFEKFDDVSVIQSDTVSIETDLVDAFGVLDASMKVKFDEVLLSKALNLKIISCATTGSDHVSNSILKENNIELRTLREDMDLLRSLTPAAELSWALLLACARNLKGAFEHVRQGNWARESFPGIMLNGKTLGIIGCGRIGKWMSKYALAFGMKVVGYDPHLDEFPDQIKKVGIEELFSNADFISIHVHLSTETEGLVSKSLLDNCKPNVIIINTSRGKIVDEDALLESLMNNKIGAVGLDVLDGEPNIETSKLYLYSLNHDNLIITPHCGGYSLEAVEKVCIRAAEKILEKIKSGIY